MVIFNSYVKLPEGICYFSCLFFQCSVPCCWLNNSKKYWTLASWNSCPPRKAMGMNELHVHTTPSNHPHAKSAFVVGLLVTFARFMPASFLVQNPSTIIHAGSPVTQFQHFSLVVTYPRNPKWHGPKKCNVHSFLTVSVSKRCLPNPPVLKPVISLPWEIPFRNSLSKSHWSSCPPLGTAPIPRGIAFCS